MRERRRGARALQMAPGRKIPRPPATPPPKPPLPATDAGFPTELAKAAGELQTLAGQVRACRACGRSDEARVMGTGYPRAPVMLLGGHPSVEDVESGNAFTAEAEPLGKAFEALGIPAVWVYGSVAVRCGSAPAAPDELHACAPHLLTELEAVSPRVLVAFGDPALDAVRSLDGRCGIVVPASVERGTPVPLRPGLMLLSAEGLPEGVQDREAKRRLWRDLQPLSKLLA